VIGPGQRGLDVADEGIDRNELLVGDAGHATSGDFAVVDGALPAGVTLDEITGIVDGTFTSADPFDVTIRVTTLCGDADLTWASSGATALPDTGRDLGAGIAAGVGALAATGIGAALLLRRRSTSTER
jgi:LPXTG-motif cell wall-anchored protein